jgi:hypothetical protein
MNQPYNIYFELHGYFLKNIYDTKVKVILLISVIGAWFKWFKWFKSRGMKFWLFLIIDMTFINSSLIPSYVHISQTLSYFHSHTRFAWILRYNFFMFIYLNSHFPLLFSGFRYYMCINFLFCRMWEWSGDEKNEMWEEDENVSCAKACTLCI